MEELFKEYGGVILSGIVIVIIWGIFMGAPAKVINETRPQPVDVDIKDNIELAQKEKPILVARSARLDWSETERFNYMDYVQAYDKNGKDISHLVKVYNPSHDEDKEGVNLIEKGEYTLTYICTYEGISSYAQASYIVE